MVFASRLIAIVSSVHVTPHANWSSQHPLAMPQAQEFKGPPRLQALPYLFTDTRVEVHCPGRTVRCGGVRLGSSGHGHLQLLPLPAAPLLQSRPPPMTAAKAHPTTVVPPPCMPPPLSQDYRVFTGGSMEEVRAAYTRGEHAWCGLARMLHGSPNCTVAARPHGPTFVAIAKPKSWLGASARCLPRL